MIPLRPEAELIKGNFYFPSEATHCIHGQIVGANTENWRCDCVNGFNGTRCEEGTEVAYSV